MRPDIFFGRVTDVADPDKLLRCRVEINGCTDGVEDLPWYYAGYGVFSLPEVDDIVPVMIFDDCFTSGMYGRPITNAKSISDSDYETYLELYKRDNTFLGYKKSEGIQFINEDSSIVLQKKLDLFCGQNFITIDPQGIQLCGSDHPVPYGDKIVDTLSSTLELMQSICKCFDTLFLSSNWIPSCATPYTIPLIAPMSALVTKMMTLSTQIATLKAGIDNTTHCSQKVKLS